MEKESIVSKYVEIFNELNKRKIDQTKWSNSNQKEKENMVRPFLRAFWDQCKHDMNYLEIQHLLYELEDGEYAIQYKVLRDIINKEKTPRNDFKIIDGYVWKTVPFFKTFEKTYWKQFPEGPTSQEKSEIQEEVRPFIQAFWDKYKNHMSFKDVEDLFDEMEDKNFHIEYKTIREIIQSDKTKNGEYTILYGIRGNKVSYIDIFYEMYEKAFPEGGDYDPDEEIRKSMISPYIRKFWDTYKNVMTTEDIDILLEKMYDIGMKIERKVLTKMIEDDGRETEITFLPEDFKDENIAKTIKRATYNYHKLTKQMFNNDLDLIQEALDACGLTPKDYWFTTPENFEKLRNYYMNEKNHTK